MSLEPGRELDALIAEKVMGLAVYPAKDDEVYFDPVRDRGDAAYEGELLYRAGNETLMVPHYSTDIAAAWQVVEHLGYYTKVCVAMKRWKSVNNIRASAEFTIGNDEIYEFGQTVPHAICLAALKVIDASTPT